MVANRRVTGKAKSMPAGIGIGTAVSVAITVAGAALIAVWIDKGTMSSDAMGYGALATLLLSSLIGSLTAAAMIKHRKSVVCMATGLMYFCALLCCTAMFFGGRYSGVGVTALVIFAGSGASALLCAMRNGGPSAARKYRNR